MPRPTAATAADPFRRLAADLARDESRPGGVRAGPDRVRSHYRRAAALARRSDLPPPATLPGGEPARTPGAAALAARRQLDGLQRWAEDRAAEAAAGGRVGLAVRPSAG